jgi:hypothetical protein
MAAGPAGPDAIVPHITASDYWEGWTYQGGAFQLGFIDHWAVANLVLADLDRLPPETRAAHRVAWDRHVDDPWAAYRRLPLIDIGGLDAVSPYITDWMRRETRDDGWRRTAPRERYSDLHCPALHIGGWYDIFIAGTIENYARARLEAATPQAREGQRLLVGPWAHGNLSDVIGAVEFGPQAAESSLDMTAEHLRFFDAELRGMKAAPPVPRVRLFLMGANVWIDAPDWPLPDVVEEAWFLRSSGRASSRVDDGRLSQEPPAEDEPVDRFTYDPRDPVPTIGGSTFLPGLLVGLRTGAHDSAATAERPDVLVYTSDLLVDGIDVIGTVTARLTVATDAPSTDFTAKLVDIHPDGRAILVTDGILDLRFRDGLEAPVGPMIADEPVSIEIILGPTAIRFLPGHRVRLEVSSSNFPRFARHPNTAGSRVMALAEDLRVAHQRLHHDPAHPSKLILPVRR